MTENDADKIRECCIDHYFMNLYKYGDSPYWTMHDTPEIAKADATANGNALHVAIPVHKDWVEK